MKNLLITLLLFLTHSFIAQQDLFLKVKVKLQKEYPEVVLENKIIVINVWSSNDLKSREVNRELNKAAQTFKVAKLKGGSKGLVAVYINTDSDKELEIITLEKDKINNPITVSRENLNLKEITNVIYDSNGVLISEAIPANLIFQSIQQLITR